MKKEELIKQCMDSGWFTSEESACRYVEQYCKPKKVKDVIEQWNLESDVFSEEVNNEATTESRDFSVLEER